MAFHKIDDIKINGKNMAFGGYIHEAKLDVGLADKATEVVLSFVSRSGDFQEPTLSLNDSYSISFGNIFSDNFYAIEFLTNGKTMDVTFIDGSSVLDRIYVLLRHKMSPSNLASTSGIIVVGREIHPCDEDEDGKFDDKDALMLQLDKEDPCKVRCPNAHEEEQSIVTECLVKEAKEIFEVKYSFSDLLHALSGKESPAISGERKFATRDSSGAPSSVTLPALTSINPTHKSSTISVASVPASYNDGYLTTYTGTLRSVLSSWCSDFGWSYFWEKGKLNFIDTRNRPRINFTDFSDIASKTVSKSLRNTVARGTYSHYSESAVESTGECSKARAYLLKCLTLKELFGDFYNPLVGALAIKKQNLVFGKVSTGFVKKQKLDDDVFTDGIPIELFEPSVVCAYYGQKTRETFNWFKMYGIEGPIAAAQLIGKRLSRLGGIVFRQVFDKSDKALYELAMLQSDATAAAGQTPPAKPIFPEKIMSADEKIDFEAKNGYLIIAEITAPAAKIDSLSIRLSNQFMTEQDLARNFLGKHWIKIYRAPGDAIKAPEVIPNTQYLASDALVMTSLGFSVFSHTAGSYVDSMCAAGNLVSRNERAQQLGLDGAAQRTAQVTRGNLIKSILYHEKNAVWEDSDLTNDKLVERIEGFCKDSFFEIPVDTKVLRKAFPDPAPKAGAADTRELVLIAAYPRIGGVAAPSFSTSKNEGDDNPNINQMVGDIISTSYGLLGKATITYAVNMPGGGLNMKMPTASSYHLDEHPDFSFGEPGRAYVNPLEAPPQATSAPRFKVFVSTTSSSALFIPKMESVNLTTAPSEKGKLPNVMRVEYIGNELQRLTLRKLNLLNGVTCRIPEGILLQAHLKAVNNMDFNAAKESETRRYQLFGLKIAKPISIKDGLESLSVSVSSRGVFTDIVVGNSLFTPISSNYANFQVESRINQAVSNSLPSIM